MTVDVLTCDHGFRRWLAAHPGLWLEVGVFDDPALLVILIAERSGLGLPRLQHFEGLTGERLSKARSARRRV